MACVVGVCQRCCRCFSTVHRAQPPQRYTGESERETGPIEVWRTRGAGEEGDRKGERRGWTDRAGGERERERGKGGEVLCTGRAVVHRRGARETTRGVVVASVDGGEAIEAERLSVQRPATGGSNGGRAASCACTTHNVNNNRLCSTT